MVSRIGIERSEPMANLLDSTELHWSEDKQMYCDLGVDEVGE